MGFIMFLIGFLAAGLCFVAYVLGQRTIDERPSTLTKEFQKKKADLVDKFNKHQAELDEKMRKDEQARYDKIHDEYDVRIAELTRVYHKMKEEQEESIVALREEYQQKQLDIQENYHNQIDSIKDNYETTSRDYEVKLMELDKRCSQEFSAINEAYKKKKDEIRTNLEMLSEDYQKTIDHYKETEKLRLDSAFNRINISAAAQEDIRRLKTLADQLHDPSVLYKLIWKQYYENGFNTMVGQVLGNRKAASGIYKITNINNQKVYIGQTVNFGDRWRTHSKRAVRAEATTSNKLYGTMWEEGLENFTFEVVEECPKERLTERERFYIEFYQSKDYGYNSRD